MEQGFGGRVGVLQVGKIGQRTAWVESRNVNTQNLRGLAVWGKLESWVVAVKHRPRSLNFVL